MGQIVATFLNGALNAHEYWTYEGETTAISQPPSITDSEVFNDFFTIYFDQPVTTGVDGFTSGLSLSFSGGAATPIYDSGDGTSSLVYTLDRSIDQVETGTFDYTQPGDGLQDSDGELLATVSAESITVLSNTSPSIVGTFTLTGQAEEAFFEDYTISNLDGQTPTLSGPDASLFTLTDQGSDVWRLEPASGLLPPVTGDANADGSLELTIEADDTFNAVVTQNITISLTDDAIPTIEIIGPETVELIQGQEYNDEGATATDLEDGALAVTTVNPVDVNVPDTYTVTYIANDSFGHEVTAERTVIVHPPDTSPDQFDLGEDKTDAFPWETVIRTFTVEGIGAGITVAVLATGEADVTNGIEPYGETTTAQEGDEVSVRIIASDKFQTSTTGGVEINGIRDSITVTTISSAEAWTDKDLGESEAGSFKDNEDF